MYLNISIPIIPGKASKIQNNQSSKLRNKKFKLRPSTSFIAVFTENEKHTNKT